MITKVIVATIIFVIVLLLPEVTFSKQKLLLDSLKQISSIVLAITGAWSAIVYPQALQNIIKQESTYNEDFKSIEKLIRAVLTSLLILGSIVILEITAFILKLIPEVFNYVQYLREISLFVILNLYILQIWSILLTFVPIDETLKKAKEENDINNHQDELDSLNKPQ